MPPSQPSVFPDRRSFRRVGPTHWHVLEAVATAPLDTEHARSQPRGRNCVRSPTPVRWRRRTAKAVPGRSSLGGALPMTRWSMPAHATDVRESGTLEPTGLAFDRPGTPAEFLEGIRPGASLDHGGRSIESTAVDRREIAALKKRRETFEALEAVDQALAVANLNDDEHDPELRRLRREDRPRPARSTHGVREARPCHCRFPRFLMSESTTEIGSADSYEKAATAGTPDGREGSPASTTPALEEGSRSKLGPLVPEEQARRGDIDGPDSPGPIRLGRPDRRYDRPRARSSSQQTRHDTATMPTTTKVS
jgi:hypothetical protein